MHIGIAIPGILTLFLSFWAYSVHRNPRDWRLWWMNNLNALDLSTPREKKREQEIQMARVALLLSVLLALTGVSCAYWTFDHFRNLQDGAERSQLRADWELERIRGGANGAGKPQ